MSLETIPNTAEADGQTLSERLRLSALALWQRQFQHPFGVALGNGSLARANFEFYIRQDALFLDELTKTFAYAATKTSDHAEMEQFGKLFLNTLLVVASLHQRYGERFGLTPTVLAITLIAPSTHAYTRRLPVVAAISTF